jgi:hypothetical protein
VSQTRLSTSRRTHRVGQLGQLGIVLLSWLCVVMCRSAILSTAFSVMLSSIPFSPRCLPLFLRSTSAFFLYFHRDVTCENTTARHSGNICTCASLLFLVMVVLRRSEESLENGLPNLLYEARRRVIIELSPRNPENTPNSTPGASHV